MKKIFFLLSILLSLVFCSSVLAGDDYCIIDDFGCYITNEDGQHPYIMFWSETARKGIMGDMSAPYELVVQKPEFHSSKLPLKSPLSLERSIAAGAGYTIEDDCIYVAAYKNLCEDNAPLANLEAYKEILKNTFFPTNEACLESAMEDAETLCSFNAYVIELNNGTTPSTALVAQIEASCQPE